MKRWWSRLLLTGVLLGVIAAGAGAQTSTSRHPVPFEQGTQTFRLILFSLGLQPLKTLSELNEGPTRSVLIVLGDTSILKDSQTELQTYLQNGGSLLLATDRPLCATFQAVLGIDVSGDRVATLDPGNGYQRRTECPILFRSERLPCWDPAFPPFRGISFLATNRPSYLRVSGLPGLGRIATHEVAWFPMAENRRLGRATSELLFGMVWKSYPGRVLALADHSIFINSMLLQEDLCKEDANYGFALNCVNWLTDNGQRKRVLFLDEGVVVDRFAVAPSEIPGMTPKELNQLPVPPAELINRLLAAWQEENIFNRLILERYDRNQILRGLALTITAWLVCYGLYRFWRARHDTELGR